MQVRLVEACTREVGTSEIRASESGATEIRSDERGALQRRAREVRSHEARARERGLSEVPALHQRHRHRGTVEARDGRAGTEVKLSRSEVGRVLRFNALRPHTVRQWLRSTEPDFDAKAARRCDLHLNPPGDTVVVCVDEKPIQILARRYPTVIAKDGSLRREFGYVRHGIRALLAAFDVCTGEVITELVELRTADTLVAFMQRVADAYLGKTVYVVWDNLNTHGEGKEQRWTRFNERNGGRFHFVRTHIHASWLNQVECWFSILQRRVIRYGDFPDAGVLADRVLGFAALWNEVEARPFR